MTVAKSGRYIHESVAHQRAGCPIGKRTPVLEYLINDVLRGHLSLLSEVVKYKIGILISRMLSKCLAGSNFLYGKSLHPFNMLMA